MNFQELNSFRSPSNFRGRSTLIVQLWRTINFFIFRNTPQFMYQQRVWILRLFGAKIGKGVLIRSSVDIIYPWKLIIGDYTWIGDKVTLYCLNTIQIGSNTVISQSSYICAGSHEYNTPGFDLVAKGIQIGSKVWIATDCFVSDGMKIGNNSIVGARSSVFKDLPEDMLCIGNPAHPIKPRI